ncbi:recombinase family protein [Rhodococcus sp. NPDC059968]|uniref:recombinase family protein n=1 Tax=Rhodococcus sp. NPDC059968 TaxID=3347017 RepID=UPI003672EAF7
MSGIGLKVLEQGIDTATAERRAMFGMLSVLAELQHELIVANTRDGLAAAHARGRKGGRPSKLSPDQSELAQRLYDAGEHTVAQIAGMLKVPRTTIVFTDCTSSSTNCDGRGHELERGRDLAFFVAEKPPVSHFGWREAAAPFHRAVEVTPVLACRTGRGG